MLITLFPLMLPVRSSGISGPVDTLTSDCIQDTNCFIRYVFLRSFHTPYKTCNNCSDPFCSGQWQKTCSPLERYPVILLCRYLTLSFQYGLLSATASAIQHFPGQLNGRIANRSPKKGRNASYVSRLQGGAPYYIRGQYVHAR